MTPSCSSPTSPRWSPWPYVTPLLYPTLTCADFSEQSKMGLFRGRKMPIYSCTAPRSSAQTLIPRLVQFPAISEALQLLPIGPNCPACSELHIAYKLMASQTRDQGQNKGSFSVNVEKTLSSGSPHPIQATALLALEGCLLTCLVGLWTLLCDFG